MKYLLFALLFSACAQKPVPQSTVSHKVVQAVWTTTGSSPFNRIILASDQFNIAQSAQIIPNSGDDGCNTTVYLTGNDNSGSTIATTSGPNCLQYNGQGINYQRIDDLTMQFCIGSSCANYN